MSFRSPTMLLALLVVPAVVAWYVSTTRRRAQRARALAEDGLVTNQPDRLRRARHIPFAMFALALTTLAVACARPTATVRTPHREGTVVMAFDVSNSMAATDIKPSRLEAAKSSARTFVRHEPPAVRLGIVAFGDGAVIVQTPTTVRSDVLRAIDRLSIGGGTSLGQGLLTSLDAIAGKTLTVDENALASDAGKVDIGFFGSASVLVLSDGENTSRPDPLDMAEVASVAGVHVHSIGIGTEAGTVLQVNGFQIATALDSDLLKQVASVTDGTYHEASDVAGLAGIYKSLNLHLKFVAQHTEVTALFCIAALVLFLAGASLSVLWYGRVA